MSSCTAALRLSGEFCSRNLLISLSHTTGAADAGNKPRACSILGCQGARMCHGVAAGNLYNCIALFIEIAPTCKDPRSGAGGTMPGLPPG